MKEKTLQKEVIKKLETKGWKKVSINNLKDLKQNFREILDERNIKRLNSLNKTMLSNNEFERFMSIIEHNVSFSEYARFLLDDDNQITTDNGEQLYLNIFDKKKFCNNIFQVTEEVHNNGKRHDILLLINGLPICNIELKNPNCTINNAFYQTRVYSKILNSITKFIQIFVISNQNETRYFANNERLNRKYVFRYSNSENQPINNVFKFIDAFLDTCVFSKYISRYVINKPDEKNLIALRGYQVHGAEAAINHLKNSKENGYLWHATGSGKTITSFKVAQIVSQELTQYDKIIFLVDRRDLDSQTIKEYNSFLNHHDRIQETSNSKILLQQLNSSTINNKLIISTIQKLDYILKSKTPEIENSINNIKNKKIVFIIDECHRSQFGEMNLRIKKTFTNIRYIGFTGTPIFSKKTKKELVTKDIFNKMLHKYLMPNAIEDGNILPFQLTYFKNEETIDEKNINSFLSSKSNLKRFSRNIIENFDKRSKNKKYSAMVVLKDIDTLIDFYRIIKKEQQKKASNDKKFIPLKIGATFSYTQNYSQRLMYHRNGLKEIINDFNTNTNSNESIENIANYQNRLQSIIKKENENPQLNITLVVDQLLTGFDAKAINCIYIIRNLKDYMLVQAISRTNRVFREEKERGLIVNYVPLWKNELDEALKTYSDSQNVDHIIKKDYEEILPKAKKLYEEIDRVNIENLLKNPEQKIKKALQFQKDINDLANYYKIIQTIENYKDSDVGLKFNYEWLNKKIKHAKNIKKKYKKVQQWDDPNKKDKIDPWDSVDKLLFIERTDKIDSQYIRNLLKSASLSQAKGYISEAKQELIKLKNKFEGISGSELLFEILDQLEKTFSNNSNIDIFNTIRKIIQNKQNEFIKKYDLNNKDIEKQLNYHNLKERFDSEQIEKWINNSNKLERLNFLERSKKNKKIRINIEKYLNLFLNIEEILGD